MPLIMTNFLLANRLLNELDKTYEINIRKNLNNGDLLFKSDKVFTYSNFFEIVKFYDLRINKNNSYDLYDSLNKEETFQNIIDNSISYIKSNSFNKDNIILLLSIITAYNIKKVTDPYFLHFKEKFSWDINIQSRDADYYYSLDNCEINLSIPLTKTFDKSFIYSFIDFDFIKQIFNNNLWFPLGDKLFEKSLDGFRKYLSKKKLSKVIKNPYPFYFYVEDKKTLTNKEFLKSKHFENNSFYDLLEIAYNNSLNQANKILTKIYK